MVEWARVAEDEKIPDEIIGGISATGPADIADAVNPANPDSPASDIANRVIESVQSGPTNSQKILSDALGSPATDVAPKLQDAIESPAEMLKPGREVNSSICHCCLLLHVVSLDCFSRSTQQLLNFQHLQMLGVVVP